MEESSDASCSSILDPIAAVESPLLISNNVQSPLLSPSPPLSSSHPPHDSQACTVVQPFILQRQPKGLLSHMSSLGFLPSLASLWPNDTAMGEIDHRCLATVKGERGAHISSLTIVGDHLYAGASSSKSSGNSIRVWRKVNLTECGGFASGYGAAKAVVMAGDRILSAHQDLKIRVWSRCQTNRLRPEQVAEGDSDLHVDILQEVKEDSIENSHKLLASMPTVKDYIKSFIPSKNYVQVRRHHKRLWIEHVDHISMLAVGGTAVDPLLYSASWDRTIKVWKLSEFRCIESFKAHDDAINALLVAPAGFLYTASADAKVKVWQRRSGGTASTAQKHSLVTCLDAHTSAVNALALSQGEEDGHPILYSAGCDRGIVVWERDESAAQQMVATGVLTGHRHAILCLVSRGSLLCSGSADHTIRVWRQAPYGRWVGANGLAHSCVAVLQGHKGPVKCLSLVDDVGGRHLLYSSSLDYEIKVWQFSGIANKEGEEDEKRDNMEQKYKDPTSNQIWKFHSL